MSSFFKGVWQGIVASAEPLKPFFVAIGDIAEWVGEKIVDLVGWFAKLFGRVDDATGKTQDWSNAGMLVGEVIGGLLLPFKALGKILDVVKTAGGDLLEFFRNFKMPSLSLPDFVAPSFAALRTAAGGAFDWVSTAWDKTSATLQAVPEAAFSKISQLGIGTADALSGAWASAKAALSTFSLPSISIDSIKQALSPMAGLLQPLQPLVDSLKTSFGAVTQVLSALGVGLLTVASLAGRGAIVMAEWGASGKVMTDIVTAGLNLVLAPFRALIALIDTAVAGFRVIGSLLSNLPKMPDLPSFLVPSAAPVTYSAPNALPSIIGSTPGLSASGLSLPSSGFGLTPATSPFAQVATPSIISQRTDVGGKLDIRIMADGQVRTERLESNNRNFQIDARNGSMFAG